MKSNFMGDILYNQEVEKHFPHLTIGETLEFAAAARAPPQLPDGMTKKEQIEHMRDVVMAVFGLSHTINTKVGSDFIRGVSGGERKRVSTAEMAPANAPVCCWDNATRVLDSASSLDFVKALKKGSTIFETTHLATLYQPSQAIYNAFDKVAVLYQGHEIFFGSTLDAKQYFVDMGWQCPARQTTADFLTGVTNSNERQALPGFENKELVQEIEHSIKTHGADSEDVKAFKESHINRQAKHTRASSPYLLRSPTQISICLKRFYQRTWNDIASTATLMIGQVVFSLIIGSLYYGTPFGTQAMSLKMSALFFAILLNSLLTVVEIQKALAGVCADLPIKLGSSLVFNVVFYFMCGFRYEAGPFFIYYLFVTLALLCMSQIFRSLAAATKYIPQALAAAGVILLAAMDLLHQSLEVCLRGLSCQRVPWTRLPMFGVVPAYPGFVSGTSKSFICGVEGTMAGELYVNGDSFLRTSYGYEYTHLWRNFGILCAFTMAFLVIYLVLVEFNLGSSSKAETLVFLHGQVPLALQNAANDSQASTTRPDQEKIKKENRRLLDNVSDWVKPGTFNGSHGFGVVTGDMLVNGNPLIASFERNTGYVQQQDLHLHTATVRESLRLSAYLHQPKSASLEEKYEHVEKVIRMLNMEEYAEALVGFPGEGLNVEQRKLLTIGVELAAKPALLLFLDEPTSGLDSQSSWSIVALLRRLASSGQAVLCTIHQPSAMLFQQFDRLLFLAKGGRTVYFGDIGPKSRTILDYFERQGARVCDDSENPAEYILEIADGKTNGSAEKDWPALWKSSKEAEEMTMAHEKARAEEKGQTSTTDTDANAATAFAMPFKEQFVAVLRRIFQQYWQSPEYIHGKLALGVLSALFVGFSFYQPGTAEQGLKSMIFSVFMMTAILAAMVQQIMPQFIFQRDLYEVRERPSKTYHWAAFLGANILAEIPYQIFVGIVFFLYGSTFAHAVVAVLPDAETAGLFATMLFNMTLVFNGVLVSKVALPGFWDFMYRVSPMTYLVNAIIATGESGRPVNCSSKELSVFELPASYSTCADYLELYMEAAGDAAGKLLNPESTDQCEYCLLQTADQYLATLDISYSTRWRNFGLLWVYIAFNVFFTLVIYYLCRVRPSRRKA
ncbi:hypothetical protein N7493_006333 [Penicillium malachiteum]|uniref:ABC transporter domain-containing protein n=1 Tax=Penicillium malachiteum TaxID=1324776 RepID=A0AAD6MVE6_9EURO|nr:hypothetical protein N7493_006333 [Penicillium malachiteum]